MPLGSNLILALGLTLATKSSGALYSLRPL